MTPEQEIRQLKLERDQLLRAVKAYRVTLLAALQSLGRVQSSIKSDLCSHLNGPLVELLGELKEQMELDDKCGQ